MERRGSTALPLIEYPGRAEVPLRPILSLSTEVMP